jgi:hypothetical protein
MFWGDLGNTDWHVCFADNKNWLEGRSWKTLPRYSRMDCAHLDKGTFFVRVFKVSSIARCAGVRSPPLGGGEAELGNIAFPVLAGEPSPP